jgi:tetratricopeptide (TPR) repeat protein
MDEISVLSVDISNASSRMEQMAYLTEVLGLDANTAMLLYKAERLQEKGQYKLALKYFKTVLQAKPDCKEAIESALITAELLNDEEQKISSLKTIHEKAASTTSYTTMEMEVYWTDSECIITDYYPIQNKLLFVLPGPS